MWTVAEPASSCFRSFLGAALVPERAAPAAFREGDLCRRRRRPAMAAGPLFSAAGMACGHARLCIAKQNSGPAAILRVAPALATPRAGWRRVRVVTASGRDRHGRPRWARPFRAQEHPMTTENDDTGYEPPHAASPTAHILTELQIYGYRPGQDEPDPRPLPEAQLDRRGGCRHLRCLRRHAERHAPRTRPRRTALGDGQPLPPRRRPDRARSGQKRTGAEAQPEGAGWLGDTFGRT